MVGEHQPDVRHENMGIGLLGGFAMTVGDHAVTLPPAAQRLVAYLALERRARARSTTAAVLWPDADTPRAAANLRTALWRLHRAAGRTIVLARPRTLALVAGVDVDLDRAERAAQRCEHPARPELSDADVFTADVLPDWDEQWVTVHRECFRQVRLRALESLSAQHREAGELSRALHLALAAVAVEPLRESAHRQLVAVHLAEGNDAEAVRHYHFYRRMLGTQLGLPPSPMMRQLVAPLLACPAHLAG